MSEPAVSFPDRGNGAEQIATETVRDMVEPSDDHDIEDDVQHRIYQVQDCAVVYSAGDLDLQFGTDAIRERPDSKLAADVEPYPLCYCFGYDDEHVREDVAENGETDVDEWITGRVPSEGCACRYKSPLGSYCLGNVREAIDEAQEELAD